MIPLPSNIARIWDARAGQGVLIGFLSQSPPATHLNCKSDAEVIQTKGQLKHLKWHGEGGVGCYWNETFWDSLFFAVDDDLKCIRNRNVPSNHVYLSVTWWTQHRQEVTLKGISTKQDFCFSPFTSIDLGPPLVPHTSILFEDWPDPTKRVIDVVADMATVAMTQADDGVLGRGGEGMTLERRRAAM